MSGEEIAAVAIAIGIDGPRSYCCGSAEMIGAHSLQKWSAAKVVNGAGSVDQFVRADGRQRGACAGR